MIEDDDCDYEDELPRTLSPEELWKERNSEEFWQDPCWSTLD